MRYKELSNEELLKILQGKDVTVSKTYSLWSEMFSKYMDVELKEIQKDMELIRESRNIVSHNKEIESRYYQKLIDHLENYTSQLNKSFQKILVGEISEDNLQDMAYNFVGYVDNIITLYAYNFKLPSSLLKSMNIGANNLSQINISTDSFKLPSLIVRIHEDRS